MSRLYAFVITKGDETLMYRRTNHFCRDQLLPEIGNFLIKHRTLSILPENDSFVLRIFVASDFPFPSEEEYKDNICLVLNSVFTTRAITVSKDISSYKLIPSQYQGFTPQFVITVKNAQYFFDSALLSLVIFLLTRESELDYANYYKSLEEKNTAEFEYQIRDVGKYIISSLLKNCFIEDDAGYYFSSGSKFDSIFQGYAIYATIVSPLEAYFTSPDINAVPSYSYGMGCIYRATRIAPLYSKHFYRYYKEFLEEGYRRDCMIYIKYSDNMLTLMSTIIYIDKEILHF